MNNLAAIIVNYNGENYLKDCIQSIKTSTLRPESIIVADNKSTDKSLDVLAGIPDVQTVEVGRNLGPGDARNTGMKHTDARYILFLDNDAIVDPKCIGQLMDTMQSKTDAAIVTAAAVDYYHQPQIMFHGIQNHYLGVPILRERGRSVLEIPQEPVEVGAVSGLCTLIDRTKIPVAFDNDYFWNLEDMDYAFSVRAAGYKCYADPRSVVYHKEGTAGVSMREKTSYPKIRIFLLIRNRWYFILKNYSFTTLLFTMPAQMVYECFCFLFALKKGGLISYIKAHLSLLVNLPHILSKRKSVRKIRKVKDKKLLVSERFTFTDSVIENQIEKLFFGILNRFFLVYWKTASIFL